MAAFLVLVGLASCASADGAVNPPAAAGAGVADATDVLGSTWEPSEEPRFADDFITNRCGNPTTGLGAPDEGLLASETSPILNRAPGADGKGYGNVRTAVLVYKTLPTAQAAFDQLGSPALEDCLVAAINNYLDADPYADSIPRATADSFETTSAPFAAADQATLTGSFFWEEVLGGFDNSHNTALFVGRSGPIIVTAIVASNSQNPDPENPASLARRLGVSALAHATVGS